MGWLTTKVALYVAAALAIACAVLGVLLYAGSVRLGACQNEVRERELEIAALRSSIKGFQDVVAKQNASILGLEEAAKARAAAADAELARVRADAAKGLDARRRLDSLLKSASPAGSSCREGVAEVRKGLKK
jgi:hypothetical protein